MTTTQGDVASPMGSSNVDREPDHLLVLVHGIMSRYIVSLLMIVKMI